MNVRSYPCYTNYTGKCLVFIQNAHQNYNILTGILIALSTKLAQC